MFCKSIRPGIANCLSFRAFTTHHPSLTKRATVARRRFCYYKSRKDLQNEKGSINFAWLSKAKKYGTGKHYQNSQPICGIGWDFALCARTEEYAHETIAWEIKIWNGSIELHLKIIYEYPQVAKHSNIRRVCLASHPALRCGSVYHAACWIPLFSGMTRCETRPLIEGTTWQIADIRLY